MTSAQRPNSPASHGVRDAVRREASDGDHGRVDEAERLLEAGLAVMVRTGVERTPRVAEIVAEAGLSNDAFYRYFSSKRDLVTAIVERGAERLGCYLQHSMDKQSDPVDKIESWISGVLSQASDADVSHATRAVLWNGHQATGGSRQEDDQDSAASHERLSRLLRAPLVDLGREDVKRDSMAICHLTMGVMTDFLSRGERPGQADLDHVTRYCLAGAGIPR